MRAAIQAALRYPESARMAGMAGRTRVTFQYHDGEVSGVTLVTSSGSGMLDRAALAAVREAAYPKPEPALAGKTLNEQLWVTFNLNAGE
jgi:protein TonB